MKKSALDNVSAKIRAELKEYRETHREDNHPQYKAGRVDAITFALAILDILLDDPQLWEPE